ncbi:hypothetical protein OJF2_32060 [Aquisphaera giovannonii]|uniref:Uncharacterized protein n=1 Tax=Aquisphaera giovannonii TaxID=406548 RepID=A0A5B9W3L0_9BACT|nr:hypothetical protein [Aquisphaera giovannonii]QEH34665.1 hypothetical protein OJF2_32060 [Aquisphaera giovannonii]
MLSFFDVYYVAIKAFFFYGLLTAIVKFENLQKSWLLIALIYAGGAAFLSWVWLVAAGRVPFPEWQRWALMNAGISLVYFRLITWFDEGVLFWTLLLLGMAVVWF